MNPSLLALAVLPSLASCDAYQHDRTARKHGEKGCDLVVGAKARLAKGSLTPLEQSRTCSEITEAIIELRLGLSQQPSRTFWFDPVRYQQVLREAEALSRNGIWKYEDRKSP